MTETKEEKHDLIIGQIIISLDRLYGKRRRQEIVSRIGNVPDVSAVLSSTALKVFDLPLSVQSEILDGLDKENCLWIFVGKENIVLTQLETCPVFETKCIECSRKIVKLRNGAATSKEGLSIKYQYLIMGGKAIYKYEVYFMQCSKCKKKYTKEGKILTINSEPSKIDESNLWVGESILAIDQLYGKRKAQEACVAFQTHKLFPTPSPTFLSIIELPVEKQASLINTLNSKDVIWSNLSKKKNVLNQGLHSYSFCSNPTTICYKCDAIFPTKQKDKSGEIIQDFNEIIFDGIIIYEYILWRFLCGTCTICSSSDSVLFKD